MQLKIGFDRYVQLDWCHAALDVACGTKTLEQLDALVAQTLNGVESRRKTIDILKRLWISPFKETKDLVSRGVNLYCSQGNKVLFPLCWGTALATYPFFAKVAEISGRLISLQDSCSILEVQRRIAEIYGERDGIVLATSRVLQSQENWGAIERVEKGKRLIRCAPIAVTNDQVLVWLVEAALRYTGRAVSVSTLQSMKVIYPFALNQSLTYVISNSPALEMWSEGPSNQFVALRKTA